MPLDLSLYLVVDPAMCARRGVVSTVAAAVDGGVSAVQLRDKDASARDLYSLATALVSTLDGTGVPLLVNDRLDVALAAGADGVHLGQDDLPVQQARSVAGPDFLIGLSVSTAAQAAEANALPVATVDYVGASPVFATPTKPEAAEPLGLRGLTDVCEHSDLPCVAIGGIHSENVDAVRACGVDGVAVVSAICAAPEPAEAAAALRAGSG